MHPFRAAIEARDIDAAIALLADDVEFRSPIVYAPFQGRDSVGELIRGVARVFRNFRYVREIGAESGRNHALVFSARVGDKEVEGCGPHPLPRRRIDCRARGHGAAAE